MSELPLVLHFHVTDTQPAFLKCDYLLWLVN